MDLHRNVMRVTLMLASMFEDQSHRAAMLALARRLATRDHEDLVQDALTRAWASRGTFDGRDPRSWLLRILRNVCHDQYRKSTRQPREVHEVDEDPFEFEAPDRTDAFVDEMASDGLRAVLSRLYPGTRRVLMLVADGYGYDDAAAIVGIPRGTVGSRLHRARRTAEALKHDGPLLP